MNPSGEVKVKLANRPGSYLLTKYLIGPWPPVAPTDNGPSNFIGGHAFLGHSLSSLEASESIKIAAASTDIGNVRL